MVVSSEIAGLAMSVASGVVKLGRRLDQIAAEEEALRSNLALPFPKVVLVPSIPERKRALKGLLEETRELEPDPLAQNRAKIEALLTQSNVGDELWKACQKHDLTDFGIEIFDADEAFRQTLLSKNAAWDLDEDDIRKLTYFVAAGPDRRRTSLSFRLGATVVDVLAEFTAENTRFLVDNESSRSILETILRRFSAPDLAKMSGWDQIVRQAVRATANGLIDSRELLHQNKAWLEHSLNALARARDESGDDFVLGLMRGEGFRHLVRGVLEETSKVLAKEDASILENVLADVVLRAAELSKNAPDFETYFQENWNKILGAGLSSIRVHGTILLSEEDPVVQTTLTAAVGALAGSLEEGRPGGETLVSVVEASIAVFADDPSLLAGRVSEEWMRDLISSVAGVVGDQGLLEAFSPPTLDRYARETLRVLSLHPHVLAKDNQLAQAIVQNVLSSMAKADALGLEVLAEAAVTGSLQAIAENPELIGGRYSEILGEIAGKLAERVADHSLSRFQAIELVEITAAVLAANAALFLEARDGLASAVLDAVLDVADDHESGLLTGPLLVSTAARLLEVFATRGRLVAAGEPLSSLRDRLEELLGLAMEYATAELGKKLAQEDVPEILALLVDAWVEGEVPELSSPDFDVFLADLSERVTA